MENNLSNIENVSVQYMKVTVGLQRRILRILGTVYNLHIFPIMALVYRMT